MISYIKDLYNSPAYAELRDSLEVLEPVHFKDKYYSFWFIEGHIEGVFMAMSPEGKYIFTLEGEIELV
ncbi:hypothetical protein D307_gp158 [Bacillus phage Bastille]|nr:hypothetical protein D307_gp158 [Bacillus phage Bastille]YP_009035367.1 hypothetical protein FP73_gp171 [Bacillus phage Hoody T]YP_009037076.1 hypothetical protein FP74_gp186 [Bacillus phage CAM003]ASU01026.1 hypothetical protein ANTHONY_186 [Bacillus phage Anthony]AEQ34306.1 hypothetical protein [Bacillus phage Bastille]AHZ09610.1 hypothetical protein [Bacillus phage CAM003]AHZ10482.1 hypothetical protein [Bacillus phage Hoody T]